MEKKKQPPKNFGQKVSLRQVGFFLDFFNKKKVFFEIFSSRVLLRERFLFHQKKVLKKNPTNALTAAPKKHHFS